MKNILFIIIAIAAIGAAAYLWSTFMGADTATTATVARVSAQEESSKELSELIGILKTLRSTKIDATFTTDPVFQSLIDFSPPIAETVNKGRPNPFIPASSVNAYVSIPVKSVVTKP